MLLITERQRDESCEPSKKQRSFENRGAFDTRILTILFFFFSLQNIHENFRADATGLYIALGGNQ